MSENLLELKDIRRAYASGDTEVEVLHGINFSVKRGELVAIIGPSGSGKSTLMNIIGCLDKPSSGSYTVDGRDTLNLEADDLAELRRDFFGFIFQRYHLLSHLDASENVQVPSVYAGTRRDKRQERAVKILERLGLGDRTVYKPSQLSGGQQQRVSIARALMNGGQIILADEPTGALDTKSGEEVMKILEELNAEGHTVILVTHDPRIAAHAHRSITIQDGMIKSDEPNPELKAVPHEVAEDIRPVIQNSWAKTLTAKIDRFEEAYVMAWRAMISNRMRTLLTMLGIIIGIMAVVSVVALARGASDAVIANISSLGTNTITVMPGQNFGDTHSGKIRTLTVKDMNALRGQPFVDSVTAVVQDTQYLRYGNTESKATAYGVNADYFRVYGQTVGEGRLYTEDESSASPQICVIDYKTKTTLFPNEDPLGKHILVGKVPLTVIGVLEDKEVAFRPNDSLYIYIPYQSYCTRIMQRNYLSSLIVRIGTGFSTPVAESSLIALIKARHGRQDFFIQSSDTIMKSINETTGTFTLLISAIAVISLIVGGIGVMNIMLVSVTERTREIGIRMAVGARQSDIMTQFLIEAVTVCIIGGFAGVLLSIGLGWVMAYIAPSVPMSFSLMSILVAVLTSLVIGMIFGFMPARNAARLDPIEALARE